MRTLFLLPKGQEVLVFAYNVLGDTIQKRISVIGFGMVVMVAESILEIIAEKSLA